nr:PREDICTED: uncharacterized protein LOC106703925 [Latimeria chalumnae]|eukprot:XP_014345287.1 PREDICTED: uncharacterized protein LOC106703925 [Latimeria chalumnae]
MYFPREGQGHSQGPIDLHQGLCRVVQQPKKADKAWPEAERKQGFKQVSVIHPVERLLLVKGEKGEQQTSPGGIVDQVPDQKDVVKDCTVRDRVGLVRVDHRCQHGLEAQRQGLGHDLLVRAEQRDGLPVFQIPQIPFLGQQGKDGLPARKGHLTRPEGFHQDPHKVGPQQVPE